MIGCQFRSSLILLISVFVLSACVEDTPPELGNELKADASATSNVTGIAPLNVAFNASRSSGQISAYYWNFGDGNSAGGVEQGYEYQVPGNYQAQLIVEGEDGSQDSTLINITVQENSPPQAVISSSSVTGMAPFSVQFNGQGSRDDQGIVDYQWQIQDINLSGPIADYTFNDAGTYVVALTVRDIQGLESRDEVTIRVSDANTNIPPVADASRSSNLSGEAPLTVNLDASASSDDRNQIDRYVWELSNDHQVEGPIANITFDTAGSYRVYLTVFDVEGLSDRTELMVNVGAVNSAPQAVIRALGQTTGLAPYQLSFTSAESSDDTGIVHRRWYLNNSDSVSSETQEARFNFSEPGLQTVRLEVIDEQGLSSSQSMTVEVLDTNTFAQGIFSENCSVCHGANGEGVVGPDLRQAWTRPILQSNVSRMVPLYGDCQTIEQSECIDAVTGFIISEFATSPVDPEPDPETPAEDIDDFLIGVPIKALTEDEFYNTLESLFSISFSAQEKIQFNVPLNSSDSRYSTDSELRVLRGLSTDPAVLDDLYPALTQINTQLVSSLGANHFQTLYGSESGCGFSSIGSSASCRTAYSRAILSKAFRRSVATGDYALTNAGNAYTIFINQGLNPQDAFINATVSYILFSPDFLFHSYRGQSSDNNSFELSNQELAHKVSYLVWGAPADTTLLSRDWHQLLSSEDESALDAELVRLFADAKSKYFIDTFLQQWLRLESNVQVLIQGTDNADRAEEYVTAIKGESEHFIRHLITQNEAINSVLNANYTFMNRSLADFYGLDIPDLNDNFVQLQSNEHAALRNRQGLLTQANFLTTDSKSDRPATVHRGVTILKEVMCYSLGPPSGARPELNGVDRTMHTESALFRMVTETPGSSCIGCHRNINPVSFPFEVFDRFGRHPMGISSNGSLPEYAVYEAVGIASNANANGPVEKADTFYLDVLDGNVDFDTDYGRNISGSFDDHKGLISVLEQSPAFSECLNDNLYDCN